MTFLLLLEEPPGFFFVVFRAKPISEPDLMIVIAPVRQQTTFSTSPSRIAAPPRGCSTAPSCNDSAMISRDIKPGRLLCAEDPSKMIVIII